MKCDINKYKKHIEILEIINMTIFFIIILSSTIITLLIFRKFSYALLAFIISIAIAYIIFAILQLQADKHKLQIDIYKEITKKKAE